jgi:RNA polymerase sigma-70 factor (ECF subfamily)
MNRLHIQDSSLPKEKAEKLLYRLLDQYEEPLFRFVYFKINHRESALDIVQDIFTKVWIYICDGKKIEHEQAFLYRTARNAVIDHYKKSRTSSLDAILEEHPEVEPGTAKNEYDKVSDKILVQQLINTLPEEDATVLYLRFVEDKSLDDIARLLGKTKNATTVKIHRAVEKLKALVGNDEKFYE